MENAKAQKKFTVPHILLIIAGIAIFVCGLTYILPAGVYDLNSSKQAIAGSFHTISRTPVTPWRALLMIDKGLMRAASIISLLLIAGGSIACVLNTGAFDDVLNYGVFRLQDKSTKVLVPAIVVLMSALGAFAGNDSMIAFVTVGLVICRRLHLDRITAMAIFYFGYLVGQGTSFTQNMLMVFQIQAGVEPLSGMGVRIIIWCVFTTVSAIYCTRYAIMISKHPEKSYVGEILEPDDTMEELKATGFPIKGVITILVMFGVYLFYAYARPALGWGQEYLYALMILDAVFSALLYQVNPNEASKSFFKGAQSMGGICLVMGTARVVGMVLEEGHIIHTLSYYASNILGNSAYAIAGIGIFIITLFINLFIPSGLSKAAIMMPILTPIGDVCGITRQVVVEAYALGDFMTNTLTPMSGPLVGALGLGGVEYSQWVRFAAPLIGILAILAAIFIGTLAQIGWVG